MVSDGWHKGTSEKVSKVKNKKNKTKTEVHVVFDKIRGHVGGSQPGSMFRRCS